MTVTVTRGMPFEQYLDIDAVNSSGLKWLDKSPQHWARNPQIERTRSMSLGTLIHTAVLEPETFTERYTAVPDGLRMDKRTKAYKEFLDGVPRGSEPVTGGDYVMARSIARWIHEDKHLARFFGIDCESELTIEWTDPETGVRCKCRLDKLCPDIGILDLKTCQDCTLADFPWKAKRFGYFRQAAFYKRGVSAAVEAGLLPEAPMSFILAQEVFGAMARCLYHIAQIELDHFNQDISAKLDTIARCRESGVWPGPNGIEGASIPLEFPGALDYNDEPEDDIPSDWGE